MSSELVHYELDGKVAVLRMDDGKANALNHEMIAALSDALDRAEAEARAVVLAGREGRFCAGFDLSLMLSGPENVVRLVTAGGELLTRMYLLPRPLIVACTGHALAAGALMLLVGDLRVGVRGPFKLGLNEVRIGMPLPQFGVELARGRLSRRHFDQAVLLSRSYDPQRAIDAGYLDETADPEAFLETVMAHARDLSELNPEALGATKQRARGAMVRSVLEGMAEDLSQISGPSAVA